MITLDHPWTAAGQRQAFRLLFDAWARPGTIAELAEWSGGSRARLTVLAALCDSATTVHDAHALLDDGDRSRLGAQQTAADAAAFILADATRVPDGLAPCRGELLTPERGATLVLDCQAVGEGPALRLSGPGVDGSAELRVLGVDPGWWQARAAWCAPPLGIDLILCDARRIACIPRSSVVEF
jgi:alpha-D-ribose 1-methylphosphonate 5-triphosphate synthase subunit PhnH